VRVEDLLVDLGLLANRVVVGCGKLHASSYFPIIFFNRCDGIGFFRIFLGIVFNEDGPPGWMTF